jgi:hypothetical protein
MTCTIVENAILSLRQKSNHNTKQQFNHFVKSGLLCRKSLHPKIDSKSLYRKSKSIKMIESQLVVKSTNGIFSISDWVKKP